MSKQFAPNPRRDAARELAKQIARLSDEDRAARAPSIPVMTVEGRPLSFKNMILVSMQRPTATIVGGFKQWIAAGRCVRKGELGLYIYIPTTTKDEDGNEGETRFIMAPVFDVSQTDELANEAEAA